MTQEELRNVFECIVKKCDMLINNGNYEADAHTQNTVEDIAELCNHILDGDYGKLNETKEKPVSKDLEEELDKYIKDYFTIDTEQLDRFGIDEKDYMYSMDKSDILALVEHFTKWQKEQMMKDAIDAD